MVGSRPRVHINNQPHHIKILVAKRGIGGSTHPLEAGERQEAGAAVNVALWVLVKSNGQVAS